MAKYLTLEALLDDYGMLLAEPGESPYTIDELCSQLASLDEPALQEDIDQARVLWLSR